ncbi:phosphotransferase [Legionella fallonii]|uniref:Choline/ethanolamine kinase n=1 Tax=Legionella fallonii LLAP-10 TaxID=1212491 RepID=A0A098G2T2_9GAMM|nr:phosphotransferase [Legionella fallonii]CEG56763.1 Choline/ethanolamine kinase [Legionella fallonii LLAP-10]
MTLSFFGSKNPEVDEDVVTYILSLLDPRSFGSAACVSKDWNKYTALTRKYIDLLPTIHRIPFLKGVGLDVIKLKILSGGMTNLNFILETRGMKYKGVLRVPGKGSSAFICRADEARNARQAVELDLNVPIDFFDPEDGLQLTRFIEGVIPLDKEAYARMDILVTIAGLMRRLHSSSLFDNDMGIFEPSEKLLNALKSMEFQLPSDVAFIENQMEQLKELFGCYDINLSPCHNDTTPFNFMLSRIEKKDKVVAERMYMSDWEYSKNNDFVRDLVYFIVEADLSSEQQLQFLTFYFGAEHVTKPVLAWVEVYKPIVEWWITLWYWTQQANKADAVDLEVYQANGDLSFKKTVAYLQSQEYKEATTLIQEEADTPLFSRSRAF